MSEAKNLLVIGSLALSVISVLFIILSVVTNQWIYAESLSLSGLQIQGATINYGLYGGTMDTISMTSSSTDNLYMTCVASVGVCAVSCKTNRETRRDEVTLLGEGMRPQNLGCNDYIGGTQTTSDAPVISLAFYIFINIFIYVQLLSALCCAIVAFLNVSRNLQKPKLQGVIFSTVISALAGILILLMWGVYYSKNLQLHLAFPQVAYGNVIFESLLGYSYWLVLPAVICSITVFVLAELRIHLED